jgi:hypothetical protein
MGQIDEIIDQKDSRYGAKDCFEKREFESYL